MAIDQARYDALFDRFQRQVSIPNCPDKLSDTELLELIEAWRADAATAGLRGAKTKVGKAPAKVLDAATMDSLLAKMTKTLGGTGGT